MVLKHVLSDLTFAFTRGATVLEYSCPIGVRRSFYLLEAPLFRVLRMCRCDDNDYTFLLYTRGATQI